MAREKKQKVSQGDAILVFPGNPHWYGPTKGNIWDEVYIAFDGPLFDAWFRSGLLNPLNPIRNLGEAIDDRASWLLLWIERFVEIKDEVSRLQAINALMISFRRLRSGKDMRRLNRTPG